MNSSFHLRCPSVQFIHIPKCAGTSIWHLLAELSGEPEKYQPAHNPLKPKQTGEYIFTIMREPVERIISLYSYAIYRGDFYLFEKAPYLWGSSLYEFSHYLYSTHDPAFFNCMIQFMDGSFPTHDVGTWHQAVARINSNHYDHIGFVDRVDDTISWLAQVWGKSTNQIQHMNRTDKAEKLVSEIKSQPKFHKALELIIDANTQDIMVYQYFRQALG
jgi:hypothetical protein